MLGMFRVGTTDGFPVAVAGGCEGDGAFEVRVAEGDLLAVAGLAVAGLVVAVELVGWLVDGAATVVGEPGGGPPALPRLLKKTIAPMATTMTTAAATTAIRTRGPRLVLSVSLLISSL